MKRLKPDSGFDEDGGSEAFFLLEESGKDVFDVDLLMGVGDSEGLSGADGLLKFFGEAIEIHGRTANLLGFTIAKLST
jgi:hypothetical protein